MYQHHLDLFHISHIHTGPAFAVRLVIIIILNLVLLLNLDLKALPLALDFKLDFILKFCVVGFIFRLCLASEFDFFGFFGYSIIVILLVSTSDTV